MINAVISQSIVDVGRLLHDPMAEGNPVKRQDGAALSSYLASHVDWFGCYVVNVHRVLSLISLFIVGKMAAKT
jgi:hypothetical protein